jgi:hypothetical protein
VIAGDRGERVHALLVDRDPLGRAELLTGARGKVFNMGDGEHASQATARTLTDPWSRRPNLWDLICGGPTTTAALRVAMRGQGVGERGMAAGVQPAPARS